MAEITIWRTGSRVPLNVYAGDRAVCQCHTPEDSARIVEAMNKCSRDEVRAHFALPGSVAPVPDGHWCQNCSRVPVEKHGDVCEGCREILRRHHLDVIAGRTPEPENLLEICTPGSSRCGHNFLIPKCPYKHCAARELYGALLMANADLNEHDCEYHHQTPTRTKEAIDSALKLARGEGEADAR